MTRRQLALALLLAGASFAAGNYLGAARQAAPVVAEVVHDLQNRQETESSGGQEQVRTDEERLLDVVRELRNRLVEAQQTKDADRERIFNDGVTVGWARAVTAGVAAPRLRPTFADVARAWGITGRLDCAAVGAGAAPHAFDERLGTLR